MFGRSLSLPSLPLFAGEKKRLRRITVAGGVTPEGHHQWTSGQLNISVRVTPKRRNSDDHPSRRSDQAQEQRAILEKLHRIKPRCPVLRHSSFIVRIPVVWARLFLGLFRGPTL